MKPTYEQVIQEVAMAITETYKTKSEWYLRKRQAVAALETLEKLGWRWHEDSPTIDPTDPNEIPF